MKLVEYLFSDPGTPPTADNSHMAGDRGEDGLGGRAEVPHAYPLGDPIAPLDGGFHHLHNGYSPQEAIRYRHILGFDESVDEAGKDQGRTHNTGEYTFEGGFKRMCKCGHTLGSHDAERAKVKGKTYQYCQDCDCECFAPVRKGRKKKHESLDEVLKRGVQSDSAKDRKTIEQLEGDQFPNRAEDGKGFCFHWADGRGVCGFTKKSDALCWLKESPRDVVRFWYGEPVVGSKERRFKLSGNYTPKTDEGKKLEHGPYDNRAIGKLKKGKYPGRAEDGKGFCFVCATGAITAFRWRGDAMRWAQDQPREITKFWYGEPIAPSGKFRVRVRDRYRKDESHTTFSSFLEHRASA